MWGNKTANKHARFNRLCMSNPGVRYREIKQKKTKGRYNVRTFDREKKKKSITRA